MILESAAEVKFALDHGDQLGERGFCHKESLCDHDTDPCAFTSPAWGRKFD